ncbi:sensor histidine kinase [Paenarthrobacter sp. NPDC089675]|uniref:sensor histidine kinase n=1 Tax=Paenarthrobacter sp. NPDC089675 TaxID=3364376 RepID=UPI0037F49972
MDDGPDRAGRCLYRHPVLLNTLGGTVIVAGLWFTVVPADPASRPWQLALGVLLVAGLCLRTNRPWAATICTGLLTLCGWWFGLTGDPFIVTALCLYGAAERYGERLLPRAFLLLGAVLMGSLLVVSAEGAESALRAAVLITVVLGTAWIFGVRTRRLRAETAHAARTGERLRLARDVHDVLSHSLGSIGVRAGVVAYLKSSTPDQLRSTLRGIEADARSALTQLQAVMRQERGSDLPGGKLTDLVQGLSHSAEQTGIAVTISAADDANHVPAAQRTTAYRIVQESLTNVIRHSTAKNCHIGLGMEDGSLLVTVEDDGPALHGEQLPSEAGPGYGLQGMRERVDAVGGTFRAGGVDGGYLVTARLPLAVVEESAHE